MIGPDIPEHLIKKKQEEKEKEKKVQEEEENTIDHDEQDDIDAFMPELPPDLLPAQPKKKRVMGPAFPPPTTLTTTENDYRQQQEEKDEDDMVGPSLPKDYDIDQASLNATVAAIEERARQSEEAMLSKDDDKEKKVERPEWMLAPPDVDYLSNATSGRPRSFNQRTVDKSQRDSSGWTDTPADKARKQQQTSSSSSSSSTNYNDTKSVRQELATQKKIEQHNKTERPMSLLEMHRQNKKGNKRKLEDDPRQRGFDRDKDLVSARPMSKKQKQELLQKSSEWSDRFGHSRGSSFL